MLCKEEIGISPDVKAYRLLVRAPIFEEKTKGGIILMDDFREDIRKNMNVGKVIKIGARAFQGDMAKAFTVNVGDWVIYSKYEREPFLSFKNNQQYLCYFINDDRILASLSEDEAMFLLDGGK